MKTDRIASKAARRLWACASLALFVAGAGCSHTVVMVSPGGGGGSAVSCDTTVSTPIKLGSGTTQTGSGPDPGGPFAAVQQQTPSGGGSPTICNQTVSGTVARFWTAQIPDPGKTGFRGFIMNDNLGTIIPNYGYVLQYWVNIANTGCCTPMGGSVWEMVCPVTSGLQYRFIAHFKPGYVPPTGHTVSLYGAFTP